MGLAAKAIPEELFELKTSQTPTAETHVAALREQSLTKLQSIYREFDEASRAVEARVGKQTPLGAKIFLGVSGAVSAAAFVGFPVMAGVTNNSIWILAAFAPAVFTCLAMAAWSFVYDRVMHKAFQPKIQELSQLRNLTAEIFTDKLEEAYGLQVDKTQAAKLLQGDTVPLKSKTNAWGKYELLITSEEIVLLKTAETLPVGVAS